MPKILRTNDNDFRIITGEGGQIILDTTNATDNGSGEVVIRGDLIVNGGTTTVESTITTINDTLIVLAAGNNLNGLPGTGIDRPFSAGIEVERGDLPNSRWVYDETIAWPNGMDPLGQGNGAWLGSVGNIGNEDILPIRTNGIVSLSALYVKAQPIIISDTSDYQTDVFRYNGSNIEPDPVTGAIVLEDNAIPNAKAVKDLVDYSIAEVAIDSIREDNSSVEIIDKSTIIQGVTETGSTTTISTANAHGYQAGDAIQILGATTSPTDLLVEAINGLHTVVDVPSPTTIKINVNSTGGNSSSYVTNSAYTVADEPTVEVTVENSTIANFYNNRVNLADIEIRGTEIFIADSNKTLTLSAQGSGTVKINDTLEIPTTPGDDDGTIDPNAPVDGVKIYIKSSLTSNQPGDSGIYFVNDQNRRDELISKNRALLYGMLF